MNVMFVEQFGRCRNDSRGRLMCRIILRLPVLLLLQQLLMTAQLVSLSTIDRSYDWMVDHIDK